MGSTGDRVQEGGVVHARVAVQKFAMLRSLVSSELLNESHTSKRQVQCPFNPKFA